MNTTYMYNIVQLGYAYPEPPRQPFQSKGLHPNHRQQSLRASILRGLGQERHRVLRPRAGFEVEGFRVWGCGVEGLGYRFRTQVLAAQALKVSGLAVCSAKGSGLRNFN